MKRLILTITAAFGLLVNTQAADIETTVSSSFATKYLAFSGGGVLYDNPVVQSDIFVSFTNGPLRGLYLDLWQSTGLDSRWGNNLGDEVDYGIGYSRSIGKLTLNVGVTYFDEPKAFTLGAGDIVYSHVKLSRPVGPAEVFGIYENYTTMRGTSFKGGNLFSLGASHGRTIWKNLSGYVSAIGVYDDGGFGLDHGFLLRGSLGLDWQITKHFTVHTPNVNYYVPFGVDDRRKNDAVISVGASLKF